MPATARLYLSFVAASATPSWVEYTSKMRSYAVDRGRGSEQQEFDAGTATFLLDNRDRGLDSGITKGAGKVRPFNSVRLDITDSSGTHTQFQGYVERYSYHYDPGGQDASVSLACVDELKVLALDELPNTDPPASSYAELIAESVPVASWPIGTIADLVEDAAAGKQLRATAALGSDPDGSIKGEVRPQHGFRSAFLLSGGGLTTDDLGLAESGEAGGQSEFAAEIAVKFDSTAPVANTTFCYGPLSDTGFRQWGFHLNGSSRIIAFANNSAGTQVNTGQSAALSTGTWYRCVLVVTGGTLKLYLNGSLVSSVAFGGPIRAMGSTAGSEDVAIAYAGGTNFYVDQFHVYLHALDADQISARSTAATARGYDVELSGTRIANVITDSASAAATDLDAGVRDVNDRMMAGRAPLEAIREAVGADGVDAGFFASKDGTLTYRDADHRAGLHYVATQATFGNSGSDIPFIALQDPDYSDSFIVNEFVVTGAGDGFVAQDEPDATSIATYFRRRQSLSPAVVSDTDAEAIAVALLAKFKDPVNRIGDIEPQMVDDADIAKVLGIELLDRVRWRFSPPGGGAQLDQSLFVQRISLSGTPAAPPRVVLGVSPL